jgi:hypothetical protein
MAIEAIITIPIVALSILLLLVVYFIDSIIKKSLNIFSDISLDIVIPFKIINTLL